MLKYAEKAGEDKKDMPVLKQLLKLAEKEKWNLDDPDLDGDDNDNDSQLLAQRYHDIIAQYEKSSNMEDENGEIEENGSDTPEMIQMKADMEKAKLV